MQHTAAATKHHVGLFFSPWTSFPLSRVSFRLTLNSWSFYLYLLSATIIDFHHKQTFKHDQQVLFSICLLDSTIFYTFLNSTFQSPHLIPEWPYLMFPSDGSAFPPYSTFETVWILFDHYLSKTQRVRHILYQREYLFTTVSLLAATVSDVHWVWTKCLLNE